MYSGGHMKSYYRGLDFLRGLGVFFVIILHTGFYFYDGLYDLDLNHPSLLITIIGFLLMFAGLFAMISGVSHSLSFFKHHKEPSRIKYMLLYGGLMLIVAYLYFLFTGPGIVLFESRSMDESLIVSLIGSGRIQNLTIERIFYVDSLVMISLNIILLSLLFHIIRRFLDYPQLPKYILITATLFMGLSYLRIPLYTIYINAVQDQQWLVMIILNWLVAKNNPIFPFYAFALFGVWIALLLKNNNTHKTIKWMLFVGLFYLLIGITGYILAPETMLERAIDPTWYFIMVTQIGIFILFILIAFLVFDFNHFKDNFITRFISRFGVAGLSVFFIESVVSVLIYQIIRAFVDISLNIPFALCYGLVLALLWGIFLKYWEKKHYVYGIEHWISRILSRYGNSSKSRKLNGDHS
jgi:hypothetical protein